MHDSSKRLKTHNLRVSARPPGEEGEGWGGEVALHYVACATQQLRGATKKKSLILLQRDEMRQRAQRFFVSVWKSAELRGCVKG